ncbi:hypothetical protein EB118_25925, partial [bacterium]|nr:hypothetical protein [bacterium]
MQDEKTTDKVAVGPDTGSSAMPSLEDALNSAHTKAALSSSTSQQSSASLPMTPTVNAPVSQPSQPSTPVSPKWFFRFRSKRLIPIAIGAGLLCAVIVIASTAMRTQQSKNAQLQSVADASNYNQTAVPLAEISASEKLSPTLRVYESVGSLFTVNGDFGLNGSAVVSAISRPANPRAGELWFQQDTKKLYFYDGSNYIDVTYAETANANLQALATRLQNVVTSVQSATGNITLSAGTGIAVSGTTITNTGVVAIESTTPDLTITN